MLHLFGMSFRTAPVAVRKTFAFDAGETAELLTRAAVELPGLEVLVLSTCNRTEFYLSGPAGPFHELLKRMRPEAPATPPDCSFSELSGTDAFRHLSRVACGLDSAILGDCQLLSQLRAAVGLSQAHGTLGRELSAATAAALRLGRAARAKTGIAAGSAGIGSAVVATLDPGAKRVAVLGAGEAARSVTRHLTKRGIVDLIFCNRTGDQADKLAAEHGGTSRPWAELEAVLDDVDAVAVATAAAEPVLGTATLTRIAGRRQASGAGALVVIDAGFPPQVAAEPVPGVRLVPLDALHQGEAEALDTRRAAVPAVEAMVDEAVATWTRQRSEARLSGAIQRLHEQGDGVIGELAEALAAVGVARAEAEQILRRPLRRLLHEAVSELRAVDRLPLPV